MMQVQAVWLALGASDLRGGFDSLLARVLAVFGRAQPHHAYVFANRRVNRLKVLLYDGSGLWLCARRLQAGGFAWPRGSDEHIELSGEQFNALVLGLAWQHIGRPLQAITVI